MTDRAHNDNRLELVHRFFSGTGSSYDFIVHACTLGFDGRWKRTLVSHIPPGSKRIVDLACGTGIFSLTLARQFPNAKIVGVELREEYLQFAREKAAEQQVTNVEFVLSRAEDYRSTELCDCVVSSYLAKYADLPALIPLSKDMLRDDGVLLMHDFTYPPKAYLVSIFKLYFWFLQRIGSRIFPAWKEIFYGLPRLIEETGWLEELPEVLKAEGFQDIHTQHLTVYGAAIIKARKSHPGNVPPLYE